MKILQFYPSNLRVNTLTLTFNTSQHIWEYMQMHNTPSPHHHQYYLQKHMSLQLRFLADLWIIMTLIILLGDRLRKKQR